VAALYTRNNRPSRCHWLLLLLLPLPPPLPPPPTPPFLPSTPPAPPPPPPLGYALSSLSRARVSAHTRAPAGSIRARERTYTRRMHSGARVRVRVSGRRVHTRTAHARVSRFSSLSHVHIRRSEMREKESTRERRREREKERPSLLIALATTTTTAAARNRSLTRSHRHGLSRRPRARARARVRIQTDGYTHKIQARVPIRFSDAIFPVVGNESRPVSSYRPETRSLRSFRFAAASLPLVLGCTRTRRANATNETAGAVEKKKESERENSYAVSPFSPPPPPPLPSLPSVHAACECPQTVKFRCGGTKRETSL